MSPLEVSVITAPQEPGIHAVRPAGGRLRVYPWSGYAVIRKQTVDVYYRRMRVRRRVSELGGRGGEAPHRRAYAAGRSRGDGGQAGLEFASARAGGWRRRVLRRSAGEARGGDRSVAPAKEALDVDRRGSERPAHDLQDLGVLGLVAHRLHVVGVYDPDVTPDHEDSPAQDALLLDQAAVADAEFRGHA